MKNFYKKQLNKKSNRYLGEAKGLVKISDNFDEMPEEWMKHFTKNKVELSDIPSVYNVFLDDDISEVSELESPDMPSLHQGRPLSLEDMEQAIDYEASQHK